MKAFNAVEVWKGTQFVMDSRRMIANIFLSRSQRFIAFFQILVKLRLTIHTIKDLFLAEFIRDFARNSVEFRWNTAGVWTAYERKYGGFLVGISRNPF